jgi:hypothetical protein
MLSDYLEQRRVAGRRAVQRLDAVQAAMRLWNDGEMNATAVVERIREIVTDPIVRIGEQTHQPEIET